MLQPTKDGERYDLLSPTEMPRAAGFLWNPRMMIQVTCRGFAVSQFMQPEPAKYAHAPTLEARTFMQPEQPYYAHHPGRFVYVKDEEAGRCWSAPHEPARVGPDRFVFSVGKSDIRWRVEKDGIAVEWTLGLAAEEVVELWQMRVTNVSGRARRISVYPYFPMGYMSWMNQSARYEPGLVGVVARSVTPYQKVADYFKNRLFKDWTVLLADTEPEAWETRQEVFEGEGGLMFPDGARGERLANGEALYEMPAAVLQYRWALQAGESREVRLLFGPAFDEAEVRRLKGTYLVPGGFEGAMAEHAAYVARGQGSLQVVTADPGFDNFVNHWLPRQVFYHGDVNRLTTDPQTRNYLQDAMGMSYVRSEVTRRAFLHALSQQEESGAMPDGILLMEGAELKYINQIPHTDHCVWLPVCLKAYLDETDDYGLLREQVVDAKGRSATVLERVTAAMRWLLKARDGRGLSYIAQGDWCDPMNMVGYKGRGVSGWLSVATAYALNLWADVCEGEKEPGVAEECRSGAVAINRAVNEHLWDGNWFGRGITDDGVVFGVSRDVEGRIFLNPQSWGILAGAADEGQRCRMLAAVEAQLETPYGVMLVGPAFTRMREDVGRVTQKHPGSAENGSVYNHAAVFYIYSLFTVGEGERAYRLMRQMIPGPDVEGYRRRGQLPVFIPNYYRGAYHQLPQTAGRSSQLFNTGTVSWFYRCLVEGLFGLRGSREGLVVSPQLPAAWREARAVREFRGATFQVEYRRDAAVARAEVRVDGQVVDGGVIKGIEVGRVYQVEVKLPG